MYAPPLIKTYLHFSPTSGTQYQCYIIEYLASSSSMWCMLTMLHVKIRYTISQIVFSPTVSKVVLSEHRLNVYKCRQKSIPNYKSMSILCGIIVIFVIRITKICT